MSCEHFVRILRQDRPTAWKHFLADRETQIFSKAIIIIATDSNEEDGAPIIPIARTFRLEHFGSLSKVLQEASDDTVLAVFNPHARPDHDLCWRSLKLGQKEESLLDMDLTKNTKERLGLPVVSIKDSKCAHSTHRKHNRQARLHPWFTVQTKCNGPLVAERFAFLEDGPFGCPSLTNPFVLVATDINKNDTPVKWRTKYANLPTLEAATDDPQECAAEILVWLDSLATNLLSQEVESSDGIVDEEQATAFICDGPVVLGQDIHARLQNAKNFVFVGHPVHRPACNVILKGCGDQMVVCQVNKA